MKKFVIVFSVIALVMSCNTNNKETSVIWVSGFKAKMDTDKGTSEQLLISKTESLENEKWEPLFSDIDGFVFEEGVLKKLEVLESKIESSNDNTDQNHHKFTLIKVLDTLSDHRLMLNKKWQLELLGSQIIKDSTNVPTLQFNLNDMSLSGHTGCNSYQGAIAQLGINTLEITNIAKTLRLCSDDTYEDKFMNLFNQVKSYDIEQSRLIFKDASGKPILAFSEEESTPNQVRIYDIWNAVRVGGYPINRMVTVPRFEVNTQDMKIYGNDGCNEYFGSITQLSNTAITIENIGSTRKMCPDMEFPERYMTALKQVKGYDFEENILILKNANDEEVLAFIKGD